MERVGDMESPQKKEQRWTLSLTVLCGVGWFSQPSLCVVAALSFLLSPICGAGGFLVPPPH